MKYLFRIGQRVRMTKTTNRPNIKFGTVHSVTAPLNKIIEAPSKVPTRKVNVLVDGAAGVTTWPLKFWRPKL